MNIQETLALIEALRANGVTRFKSQEHEIDLSVNSTVNITNPVIPEVPPAIVKDANDKIQSLINTIKMTPEQLADQIFPDGAI